MPVFDEEWIVKPETQHLLDASRQCRDIFEEIPSTEIWSVTMFDKILAQIEDCISTNSISNKNLLEQVIEHLQSVKEFMKEMTRIRRKGHGKTAAMLTVYQNRTFSGSNLILGKGKDIHFVYSDSGFPNFHRFIDSFSIENYQHRIELMLSHLQPLTPHHLDLFDSLENKLFRFVERSQRFYPTFFEMTAENSFS